ncbi:MAG TPA: tRNA glutamyl-Q(34) synthetase GluQRS [Burkholderiales bacterium]|jgi:glutamyl-Q tRNA(Asp) synthetase|nr:tRNA glutamyl-Q(34) synthetase GluQRS [Burkholderiales bacterium]
MSYRGRFAPSPSGPLHFGSMIAAIGSYCDARAHGGSWQLRIDDLDPPRTARGAVDAILRCLEAHALQWDGPVVFQSRRSDAYHAALHRLRQAGRVFPCACSRKEIAEIARAGGEGPVYPGTCRDGLPPGRPARALRVRVEDTTIAFDDLLQGRIERHLAREFGDFVLYRADHVYAYHLACVVDDAEEGVDHVVRGADLLDSTSRQIYLQRLLRVPTPRYLHLPVALDASGRKLSKQARARPVDPAQAPAVIGAVAAFLGQRPPADLERSTPAEALRWVVSQWSRERLPATRAIALQDRRFAEAP